MNTPIWPYRSAPIASGAMAKVAQQALDNSTLGRSEGITAVWWPNWGRPTYHITERPSVPFGTRSTRSELWMRSAFPSRMGEVSDPPIGVRAADILIVRSAQKRTDIVRRAEFHSGPWQVECRPRRSARPCHLAADGTPVPSRPGLEPARSRRSVRLITTEENG